jgi:hypothetical protein
MELARPLYFRAGQISHSVAQSGKCFSTVDSLNFAALDIVLATAEHPAQVR